MTFLELQKLVRSRLGEVAYFEVAQSTIGDSSDTALKLELNAAYQRAVNILDEQEYYHTVTEEDVSVSSGTSSLDLSSELASAPRVIIFVGYYAGNDTSRTPTPCTFPFGGSRSRQIGGGSIYWPEEVGYREMWMQGNSVGWSKATTAATTLHVRYSPVITSMSASSDTPSQVPVKYHEYIAQLAALNMSAGEPKIAAMLQGRLNLLEIELRNAGQGMNAYSSNRIRRAPR